MFGGGARHGTDAFAGPGDARALFVSGESLSATEGERGRFVPVLIATPSSDTSTDLSSSRVDVSPMMFQGAYGSFRTTIMTPGVPAYRLRMCIPATQDPHINDSYSVPWIRGGGRPDEDASDAASSASSISVVCPNGSFEGDASTSGDGSREDGRSRRLRHDS